ncbi:MAG: hypothetical protein A4E64_01474 [Syntrophorhabdus sp. PtaU1.Bin058]|nr:MAG: hypothetical protein A4E64_01474 [Syntrophorhabdus sp. PtaU1.Bin058]
MVRKKVLIGILVGVAMFVCLAPLRAEDFPMKLSPDAQTAMDKGIQAARQQNYTLAVERFTEAYNLAQGKGLIRKWGVYPQLYLNLGLAESRIPHHDLPAIAWFGAYLASLPDAPNASQVRAGMTAHKAKVRQVLKMFADQAKQMAVNYPDKDFGPVQVARAQALAQDREGTMKTIGEHKMTYEVCWIARDVAGGLTETGDVAWALDLFALGKSSVKDKSGKDHCCRAYDEIALQKARELGDTAGALAMTTEGYCTDDGHFGRIDLLTYIAEAQLKEGKRDEAYRTLERAKDIVRRGTGSARDKDSAYYKMATMQIQAGDYSGAMTTSALISDETYTNLMDGDRATSGRKLKEEIYKQAGGKADRYYLKLARHYFLHEWDFQKVKKILSFLPESQAKEKQEFLEAMAELEAQPADYQLRKRQSAVFPWTFEAEKLKSGKLNPDDIIRSARSKRTPKEIFDGFVSAIQDLSERLNSLEMIEYRERTGAKHLKFGLF